MLQKSINQILTIVQNLQKQGVNLMGDVSKLTAQVTQNTSVEASAIQLIQNIAAELAAANGDQAQIDALTAQLNSSATALAQAITQNTPAAPQTPAA